MEPAKTPPRTRFVILSLHRSGTSALCNMLDRHPDVLCHYEIFHPKMQIQRKKAPGLTDADLALRHSDPHAFVNRIFDECTGKSAVGFKMWRGQAPGPCKELLERHDVHKIILERGNVLARYSSHLLAHQTRIWGTKVGKSSEIDRTPLAKFDEAEFLHYVRYQKDNFKFYRKFAAGPWLYLSYERLSGAGIADVLPFLGLAPMPIEHGLQKLHSSDIIGRFAAHLHGDILRCLREIGRPEWVSENPESAPPAGDWPAPRPMVTRKRYGVTWAAKGARRLMRSWFGAPRKHGR